MRLVILSLFCCSTLLGQSFSQTAVFRGAAALQAIPTTPTSFSPSDIAGLSFWWKNAFTTNAGGNIAWTDSVHNVYATIEILQASHFTNITGGGVWFDGAYTSAFATNTTAKVTNYSIWISGKPITIDGAANAWFGDTDGNYIVRNNVAQPNIYLGGNNLFNAAFAAGVGIDFLFTSDGTLNIYTNGLTCGSAAGKTNTFYFNTIGLDAFNSKLIGFIYEICVWTNAILTLNNASNLHYYATNKYTY